jgi:hypothetical protein
MIAILMVILFWPKATVHDYYQLKSSLVHGIIFNPPAITERQVSVRASSLACKGEYAGVVIRRRGLGVIHVSEPVFFTWSETVPELLHDIHELAGSMVCAPTAVRSFLHSSEEYTGDRASKANKA